VKRSRHGFTLIEVVVVMLLLGVLLALVSPALARLYTRLQFDARLSELRTQIAALPLRAYALGEEGTLAELAARHVALPADWSLRGAEAVYIRASGLCSGGTIELLTPGGTRVLELEPPFCTMAVSE
jgi:general secretion pathway protein G